MKKILFSLSTIGIALFSLNALANPHIIIAPDCLIKNTKATYEKLEHVGSMTLLKTDDAGIRGLIAAKMQKAVKPCGGFRDVTENYYAKQASLKTTSFLTEHFKFKKQNKKNYAIKYSKVVDPVLKTIDSQAMWDDLTQLTNFKDRSGHTKSGVKAAAWIKDRIETLAKETGHDDVTVYYVQTGGGYIQPSVVAKLGHSEEPAVVIGGHMDTLSSAYELKPGADDDGSGTTTVMGVARTVLGSGLKFKRPIYFIWYAAEEAGLVGSGYVVKDFQKKNIPVEGVIQFDMTGYEYKKDATIWLIQDNVNKNLTTFLEKLITKYVKVPVGTTQCGYSCSDHASWDEAGYSAAFPFEAAFGTEDPYIHSSLDTMDELTLDHITDFAKLGTAFAIELAEPQA